MSKPVSIRLGQSSNTWIQSKLQDKETFSGYIHNLIRRDMNATIQGRLYAIIDTVIYDVSIRLEELFYEISKSKATIIQKKEVEELRDFRKDLEDLKIDIIENSIDDDEALEIYDDIIKSRECIVA